MAPERCPCGRDRPYAACCGPLHRGERAAATPEDLMRSRYAAFCLGLVDYLVRTLHPTPRAALDRAALERDVKGTAWVGLTVVEATGATCFDTTGIVAFEARYRVGAKVAVMRERSRFERVDGAWCYVDGT